MIEFGFDGFLYIGMGMAATRMTRQPCSEHQ
jgi:hypothetical protein